MRKKILVTGGAGYIGVVQTEELLKQGYDVRIFDTFFFGKKPLKHLKNKVEFVKGDIRTAQKSVLKGIDAVIHYAGLSNDPMADFDPVSNYQINTEGTVRLAALCKETGIKRFTFASSASIYNHGILKKTRLQNEKSNVHPTAAYSISKHKAEEELLKLADKNFSPIIFRQGTVYGFSPKMRYDLVVNTMIKTALGEHKIYVFCSGAQWRPMVEVNDVAIAHIKAIQIPEAKLKPQILNLFYRNYQILDLAHIVQKTIESKTGKKIKIFIDNSPRKDRSYKLDDKKIRKILHWHPQITIEESVAETLEKIKKNRFLDFENPRYYNIRWMKMKHA